MSTSYFQVLSKDLRLVTARFILEDTEKEYKVKSEHHKSFLSEYQLTQTLWHQVLPVVKSVLNDSILDRFGKPYPLTALLI